MNTEKKSFIVYCDSLELLEELSDEETGIMFRAMITYAKSGEEPVFTDRTMRTIFKILKSRLDVNSEKWEEIRKKRSDAGKKSAIAKQTATKSTNANTDKQAATKSTSVDTDEQTATKSTVNDNDNVNVNVITPFISPLGGKQVLETNSDVSRKAFDDFWKTYPKKVSKNNALKAWKKLNPNDDLIKKILSALEEQKQSPQWQKDNGQFIPYPATWLNNRRWEDCSDLAIAKKTEYSFDVGEIKKLANNFRG